jgi:Protein of unknown function (DUF3237)
VSQPAPRDLEASSTAALGGLESEVLCDLDVSLEPGYLIPTRSGLRQIIRIRSGTVSGRINGEVLPGGGDWLFFDRDRVGHIDVRLALRLTGAVIVDVRYSGRLLLPADGLKRLAAGQALAPEETYFRTAAVFTAGSDEFAWLNGVLAVGVGQIGPDWVRYRLYEVK